MRTIFALLAAATLAGCNHTSPCDSEERYQNNVRREYKECLDMRYSHVDCRKLAVGMTNIARDSCHTMQYMLRNGVGSSRPLEVRIVQ